MNTAVQTLEFPRWAFAPSGLDDLPEIAGACDFVEERRGLLGWVVRPKSPRQPIPLQVVCKQSLIGYSFAALPRPDIDKVLGTETRSGFAIGWHRLDSAILQKIAHETPTATLTLRIGGTRLCLRTVCPPTTAAVAYELVMQDRKKPPASNQGDAVTALFQAPQFDHAWYMRSVLGRDASREECLLDYIERGEEAGAQPNPNFNPSELASSLGLLGPKGALHAALMAMAHQEPPTTVELTKKVTVPSKAQVPELKAAQATPPKSVGSLVNDDEAFGVFLRDRGLLDTSAYLRAHPDAASDPWTHFAKVGDAAWAVSNAFFDPSFYARRYFTGLPPQRPFRHYIEEGEAAGFSPDPVLDVPWYAEHYGVIPGNGSVLSHFLAHRGSSKVSPNSYFDVAGYLQRHPDIRDTKIDAFEHYYNWGQFEGRWGSDAFDARYVWERYLDGNRSINALRAFMEHGRELGWRAKADTDEVTVSSEVRRNMAPGPMFEELSPPSARDAMPNVKAFAFYLPQFHAIPENDAWWGAGFTEWRNLGRGLPRFHGHYQPRCPRDLGHYDLLDGVTMRRQVELARTMGLTGFGFYYYNFNGHRLLEKPLDAFCADPEIHFPFFLIWANENWTRRWDGMEQDVLMRQEYLPQDWDALVDDLAQYMKHPEYVRLQGRPLLCFYRADVIPDCFNAVAHLRASFRARHGLDPVLMMAQAFGSENPQVFGFDAAFEFPPHKIGSILHRQTHTIRPLDPEFSGEIIEYRAAVDHALSVSDQEFPLVRTAFPAWDNDARKQGSGMCFHGSTPDAFADWVQGIAAYARRRPVMGEAIVFINAWNEWCEGAYLEPDVHFGYAYLNALSRTLRPPATLPGERMLLVGHDAFPSGAQRLLLAIGRMLTRQFGVLVEFLLLGDGRLMEDYRAVAPTTVAPLNEAGWLSVLETATRLRKQGFSSAILNTTVSGAVAKLLAAEGLALISLVHELPGAIAEFGIEASYATLRDHSQTVVFPSVFVRTEVETAMGIALGRTVVRPQGIYRPNAAPAGTREAVRQELGIAPGEALVLAVGHADMRKAPDVFLDTADAARAAGFCMRFVWIGSAHPQYMRWIERDRVRRGLDHVSFLGPSEEVDRYLAGADVFFLPSREDPFPTVVLEALGVGLPVVAFEHSGGHTDLLENPILGTLVPYLDSRAAAAALQKHVFAGSLQEREIHNAQRIEYVRRNFDFADYCADLCGLVRPERATVSVIVPNYNYAGYLEGRLRSIFAQIYPVFEIIVLDDASRDASAEVAATTAAACGRDIAWMPRDANSGSVFRQWKAGLDRARGDLIWIAEADDLSDPHFLDRLVTAIGVTPDAAFAFSDSVAIGPDGVVMYADYKGYYSQSGDAGLDVDGMFPGREFLRRFLFPRNLVLNASAVLWNATRLRETFSALGEDAFGFQCAGDWRIYVEACRLKGAVAYVAEPLNRHRRHDASVTHALDKTIHLAEVERVLAITMRELSWNEETQIVAADYITYLRQLWKIPTHALGQSKIGSRIMDETDAG